MKRYWIYIVVALFLFTALPVSAAGSQPAVTLSVDELTVNPGTDTVDVCFYYDTDEYLLDGGFLVTFPPDKLKLLIEGMPSPSNPIDPYIFLPGGYFSAVFASEGKFFISFADIGTTFEPGHGLIAKLPFKILDPAVGGDYTIHIKADRLVKWVEGVVAGENLVSDDTPIEASATLHVVPDPNATHTTTTQRYTSSPFATTSTPTESTASSPAENPTVLTESTTSAILTVLETTTTSITSIPTDQETTTSAVTTTTEASATNNEMATTTELPTATQPAAGANTVTKTTETEPFPWWIVLLTVAVAGLAVLIPLTIKWRKK